MVDPFSHSICHQQKRHLSLLSAKKYNTNRLQKHIRLTLCFTLTKVFIRQAYIRPLWGIVLPVTHFLQALDNCHDICPSKTTTWEPLASVSYWWLMYSLWCCVPLVSTPVKHICFMLLSWWINQIKNGNKALDINNLMWHYHFQVACAISWHYGINTATVKVSGF